MAWRRSVESGQRGLVGWPAEVRSISSLELSFLGVDEAGSLYWDGRPIQLAHRPRSIPWSVVAALAGGIGAALTGVAAVLRFVF
jgi:hypothetical protein